MVAIPGTCETAALVEVCQVLKAVAATPSWLSLRLLTAVSSSHSCDGWGFYPSHCHSRIRDTHVLVWSCSGDARMDERGELFHRGTVTSQGACPCEQESGAWQRRVRFSVKNSARSLGFLRLEVPLLLLPMLKCRHGLPLQCRAACLLADLVGLKLLRLTRPV